MRWNVFVVSTYVRVCPTLAVTEMFVNVLNSHSENDNDKLSVRVE